MMDEVNFTRERSNRSRVFTFLYRHFEFNIELLLVK